MNIFNPKLMADYQYRPLAENFDESPKPIVITDTVTLAVSPTADVRPQEFGPAKRSIPLLMMSVSVTPTAEDPLDSIGVQALLVNLFKELDPALDEESARALTDDLELERLENIFHLSRQGDGWDRTAVLEILRDNAAEITNPLFSRREAIKMIATGLLAGFTMLQVGCVTGEGAEESASDLKWDEYFKGNFRLMTDEEKAQTVERLERLHELETGQTIKVSAAGPVTGVLYGYAFNISKCRGYMDCVRACIDENNQDRASDMRYIRIHEHKQGQMNFDEAVDDFYHPVPAEDRYYVGTQCFHCENPPCVPVCPVKATWKEEDGIIVVDYDWCIGCRYCIAACPYDARRFNWSTPTIAADEINRNQHYLGNRLRKQGVTEKCTFCIQRTRQGQNPACVEACPTGARIFGNLLDPNSEIRWVLKNKKVFRLKEDLGTEPKFWYFTD